MVATYVTFDNLRRDGRDSVWTYVARNLSRPLALSFGAGWANVVVGNPPWVAFRHMSTDLQKRFRELANGERVYVGGKFATQNDLAHCSRARGVALSSLGRAHRLRSAARGAVARTVREVSEGLLPQREDRMGRSLDHGATDVQPLFPVPSCVAFGRSRATSRPLPEPCGPVPAVADARRAGDPGRRCRLNVTENAPKPTEATFTGGSAYRRASARALRSFRACCVSSSARWLGRLGGDPTAPLVV